MYDVTLKEIVKNGLGYCRNIQDSPCHTQAAERCKLVTEASSALRPNLRVLPASDRYETPTRTKRGVKSAGHLRRRGRGAARNAPERLRFRRRRALRGNASTCPVRLNRFPYRKPPALLGTFQNHVVTTPARRIRDEDVVQFEF
ncbi:hypothetical protein EVAR_53777_1 [Eumeta japonica]|uniref:Uncharacterized protein n=1 Tax=Eumeta variegata TaxID=151549 RepID=A0A4C1Z5X6_EUMVA|nr:hypothetical protein EVAR_53777_1 [Eumeta japonica]